jgi:hypothetical protein
MMGVFRRDGREAEGAPLLREYGALKLHRGFESLSLRVKIDVISIAPVAQLDRAPGYELGGREFESLRARQILRP